MNEYSFKKIKEIKEIKKHSFNKEEIKEHFDDKINKLKKEEIKNKMSKSTKEKLKLGGIYVGDKMNNMIIKFQEFYNKYEPRKYNKVNKNKNAIDFLSNFQDINTCSKCGTIKGPMTIHYINEDYSNFLVSNLEPLCVQCHLSEHNLKEKGAFISVSRFFSFAGAHWLPGYDGKCKQCHGHEWKLKVTLKRRIDNKSGMVLDFSVLKKIVNEIIIDKLDHNIINDFIVNPTAENLCVWIWEKLMFEGLVKGICKISIWETSNSIASINIPGMLSIFETNIEEYIKKYK